MLNSPLIAKAPSYPWMTNMLFRNAQIIQTTIIQQLDFANDSPVAEMMGTNSENFFHMEITSIIFFQPGILFFLLKQKLLLLRKQVFNFLNSG